MLYIVNATDGPNMADRVAAHLEAHQHYLHDQSDVLVLAGGTRSDDGKTRLGSIYLLNVPDRAAAETWLAAEPFNKAGIFKTVTITRMRKGHWHPENAPQSVDGA